MPELPEVETIRRGLEISILNKRIKGVAANFGGSIKNDLAKFIRILSANRFISIQRIGKLLIFRLAKGNKYLLVHLKMTGQLIFFNGREVVAGGHSQGALLKPPIRPKGKTYAVPPESLLCLPNKHTRVIIHFADDSSLFFNDLRKFGYMKLVDDKELALIKETYGIEPLAKNFKLKKLAEIFKRRSAPIKAVLLDQKAVAGIGNIYADEILFAAHVKPDRLANTMTRKETAAIHEAATKMIRKAIKYRGTTFNDYADAEGRAGNFSRFLKVYGRTNLLCLVCKTGIIKKIKAAGRGTHFCPTCQH